MYFRHLFKSNKVLKTHRFIQISQVGKWDKVPQKLDYKIGPWKHKKKLCSLKNYVNPPEVPGQCQCPLVSRRRRWWPSHRWLGRGRGQPRVLHLAPGQLTLMLWRSGHGENPPHVGPGCWGQIRKGKMLRKGWRSGKEKINAEWIFWENIISYKLSCHVAIRARASCNKYTENFLTADFSFPWQISRSEEPQSGIRLHLSDGHTSDLTFGWLADRLRNTKWQHSGPGWVVTSINRQKPI